MSCQETREKLSALADNELGSEERERVRGHLAGCPTCRRELRDQGALDMLLKSCFVKEPPEVTMEGIWPSVSDRIEGEDQRSGNGGGPVREGEIVFKSSSAMQMLRIPEPAPVPSPGPAVPAPAPRSGWVWPVTLVVSSAILAGGFVLYKRMTPRAPATVEEVATRAGEPASPGPSQPVAAPASQPSAASQPADQPSASDETPGAVASEELKGAARAKARVASKTVKVATAGKPEAKADEKRGEAKQEAKPSEAKAEAAKPARKGSDDLDNLIDNAIGAGEPAPRKKKTEEAAPPKASAEDLPKQLSMNQIRGAMDKVKSRVQACYDKYQIEGEARVSFSINPDGTVGDCSIKGKFFGTDTGTCVVAAVKKARFPKFSGAAMTNLSYPFLLQ